MWLVCWSYVYMTPMKALRVCGHYVGLTCLWPLCRPYVYVGPMKALRVYVGPIYICVTPT